MCRCHWQQIAVDQIARNLISKFGNEQARSHLDKTYDISMHVKGQTLYIKQIDIDQNVLIESTMPKKTLNSLFFLQEWKLQTEHTNRSTKRIKKFLLMS